MRIVATVSLVVALGLCALPALAQDHAGHHASPVAKTAAPGQRYATDAPLREHMAGIRAAVAALEHAGHGHLDVAQVAALADQVTGHVRTIVAECRLPPDADAALHRVIVPLAQGATTLKAAPQDLSPVAGLRAALGAYDTQFAE